MPTLGDEELAVHTFAGAVVGALVAAMTTAATDPSTDILKLLDAALELLEKSLPCSRLSPPTSFHRSSALAEIGGCTGRSSAVAITCRAWRADRRLAVVDAAPPNDAATAPMSHSAATAVTALPI